jgi:hypothetical protein
LLDPVLRASVDAEHHSGENIAPQSSSTHGSQDADTKERRSRDKTLKAHLQLLSSSNQAHSAMNSSMDKSIEC